MNARKLLVAVAVVFGVIEAIDIVDTGIPAAVFAVFFFACAAWFWQRGSIVAAAVLTFQFLVEVTQAHTWKNAGMPIKILSMTLGTIGLAAVVGVLVTRVRARGRLAGLEPRRTKS